MGAEALTIRDTASYLLANKARIGTTDARFYLVSRMRTRTPAGAAEYLKVRATHDPEAWDARVKLSMDLMDIYRELFPRHYSASRSPYFSTAREHELYRLINHHLFTLCEDGDGRHAELERMIESDHNFMFPYIPVEGIQQHDWIQGCCPFQNLQLVFQLVLVLSNHPRWKRHREPFLREQGLSPEQVAPALGALGWSLFNYYLAVGGTWLKFLPLAFRMVAYSTGSPWLDVPPGAGKIGFEWSRHNVGMLFQARRTAEAINNHVYQLNQWLSETHVGVILAIQLWNDAANMEAEEGLAGVGPEDIEEITEGRFVRRR